MPKKPEKVTVSSQRKLLLPVVAVVALSAIIVSVIWAIALSGDKKDSSAEPTPPQATVTVAPDLGGKKVKGNAPRGTVAENQQIVLALSQELLNEAYDSAIKDGTFEANSKKLLAGDYSSLPQKYQDKFLFVSLFETDKELQNISYVLVAQLSKTIIDTFGADSIQPLFNNAADNVYMDLQSGVAHVPFGIFAGDEATFSLEWVFINGEWKFSPYTLVDAVQTAQQASGGLEQYAQ